MRLRRGGRNNERPDDVAATTAPVGAVSPDENGPISSTPLGSVLGLSTAAQKSSAEPINEWGFYDPNLAGFRALMSTLDTSEIPVPGNIEEDPSDLLLRHQVGTATAPADVFEPDSLCNAGVAPHASPAASAVASCRVGHLAPLSLWARVAEAGTPAPPSPRLDQVSRLLAQWMPKAASHRSSPFASSDLAAKIGRLTHPAHVAMTGLSPVCRIRGIRTTPAIVHPEPLDELPGWPQPSTAPIPDTVTVEALQKGVAELVEMTEAAPAPVLAEALLPPAFEVAEPSGAVDAPRPTAVAEAQPEHDVDVLADLEFAAVVPPAFDALPDDFMTAVLPSVDVASLETVSFDRHVAPPSEIDGTTAVPRITDDAPIEPVTEPADGITLAVEFPSLDALDQLAASDVPPGYPLADDPISVAPSCGSEEPVCEEQPHSLPPVAVAEAVPENPVGVVEVPPPVVPVVPPIPPQAVPSPVRKRRRAALALG